jgi:hypothetical protein
MDMLSEEMSMDYALAEAKSNLKHIVPHQSDVVLSKKHFQLREELALILAVGIRQKRTLCGATLSFGGQSALFSFAAHRKAFRVYCTHLDVGTEGIRNKQLDQIFEQIEKDNKVSGSCFPTNFAASHHHG